ncbi:hypothetical protein [Corallococcus exercitus]
MGWHVHEEESSTHAAALIRQSCRPQAAPKGWCCIQTTAAP